MRLTLPRLGVAAAALIVGAVVLLPGSASASGSWNPQPKPSAASLSTGTIVLMDTAKALPKGVIADGTSLATRTRTGTRITSGTQAARGKLVTGRRVMTMNPLRGTWTFTATFGCSTGRNADCSGAFVEGGIAPYSCATLACALPGQRLYTPGAKHGGYHVGGPYSWSGYVACGPGQVDAYVGKQVPVFDGKPGHNYNSRLLAGGIGMQPVVPWAAIDKNPDGTARIVGGMAHGTALVVFGCAGTPLTLEGWKINSLVGYPVPSQRRYSIDSRPAAAGWNYHRIPVAPFDQRMQIDYLHGYSAGVNVAARCGGTIGFPTGFRGYQADGVPGGTPGAYLDSAGTGHRADC